MFTLISESQVSGKSTHLPDELLFRPGFLLVVRIKLWPSSDRLYTKPISHNNWTHPQFRIIQPCRHTIRPTSYHNGLHPWQRDRSDICFFDKIQLTSYRGTNLSPLPTFEFFFLGITGVAPLSLIWIHISSLSYPLSATIESALGHSAINFRTSLQSWTSPPVTKKNEKWMGSP